MDDMDHISLDDYLSINNYKNAWDELEEYAKIYEGLDLEYLKHEEETSHKSTKRL